jgi:hypothetical protein
MGRVGSALWAISESEVKNLGMHCKVAQAFETA